MAVLGIVLIVLAVVLAIGVSATSSASTTLEVFGVDFGVSVPTVYFLGAITGALLVAGLWLLKKGLGRGLRRRKEMRELRAKATEGDQTPQVTTDRDEPLADERPVLGERRTEDPTESHRQPH